MVKERFQMPGNRRAFSKAQIGHLRPLRCELEQWRTVGCGFANGDQRVCANRYGLEGLVLRGFGPVEGDDEIHIPLTEVAQAIGQVICPQA